MLLALSVFEPRAAMAACNASIESIDAVPTIDYEPFANSQKSEDFEVEVRNDGNDECVVALAIASGTTGGQRFYRKGTDKLAYEVLTENGSLYSNAIDVPAGSTRLEGGIGEDAEITVTLRIPAGLVSRAGNYEDTLRLRLFDVSGATPVPLGPERTIPASARIQARAQLNIAGTSGKFGAPFELDEIDFGDMTTGATRAAVVQVRATSQVAITLSSSNLGVLKHTSLPDATGVPYSLTVDQIPVDLTSSSATILRTPELTLDGNSYPMRVTIGNTTGRAAGNYKDRITISVMPQ
jgi:spore coat protein U-like protein